MDRNVAKIIINAAVEGLADGDDRAGVAAMRAQLAKAARQFAEGDPVVPPLQRAVFEAERLLDEHLEDAEAARRRRGGKQ